jgi:hypothetical protein
MSAEIGQFDSTFADLMGLAYAAGGLSPLGKRASEEQSSLSKVARVASENQDVFGPKAPTKGFSSRVLVTWDAEDMEIDADDEWLTCKEELDSAIEGPALSKIAQPEKDPKAIPLRKLVLVRNAFQRVVQGKVPSPQVPRVYLGYRLTKPEAAVQFTSALISAPGQSFG